MTVDVGRCLFFLLHALSDNKQLFSSSAFLQGDRVLRRLLITVPAVSVSVWQAAIYKSVPVSVTKTASFQFWKRQYFIGDVPLAFCQKLEVWIGILWHKMEEKMFLKSHCSAFLSIHHKWFIGVAGTFHPLKAHFCCSTVLPAHCFSSFKQVGTQLFLSQWRL